MTDLTKSLDGRPWATVADTKAGTKLKSDGGFTCLQEGEILTVHEDAHGLFVPCTEGKHYLDGQINEVDVYVGLWKVEQ